MGYSPRSAAAFRPEGSKTRPWQAEVNGFVLRDKKGAVRRFRSRDAAMEAAELDAFLREEAA